jgi:cytochrome d ubiquinol oxidase subunit I
VLAAYMVVGFGVASVYAVGYLRGRRDRYHRLGFAIPFSLAAVLTPVQIFVGDTAARSIAADQPVKFASMEYVSHTVRGAPEYLGGIYHGGHVQVGLKIPDLDSLLVGFSPHTKVTGFDTVAPALRPPVPTLIHLSFDLMVGIGTLLLLPGIWALLAWWRARRLPTRRLFWLLGAIGGPAAVLAMEAGWVVTEVGRQPWVVYKLLTTSQAATTNGGVIDSLTAVIVLYAALGVSTVVILRQLSKRWRRDIGVTTAGGGPDDGDIGGGEVAVPYGPPRAPESRELT